MDSSFIMTVSSVEVDLSAKESGKYVFYECKIVALILLLKKWSKWIDAPCDM